ncbi:hypothetical protein JCM8097_009464 [Rhodosporidiobolus ruineniae]
MDKGKGKAPVRNRRYQDSPSLIPDSQSPQPPPRPPQFFPATTEVAPYPSTSRSAPSVFRVPSLPSSHRRARPSSAHLWDEEDVKPRIERKPPAPSRPVAASLATEEDTKPDVKPKKEDLDDLRRLAGSAVNSARAAPLRDRSTAPEALDPKRVKREVKDEEDASSDTASLVSEGSKVNSARLEPDRSRGRNPSLEPKPKLEQDVVAPARLVEEEQGSPVNPASARMELDQASELGQGDFGGGYEEDEVMEDVREEVGGRSSQLPSSDIGARAPLFSPELDSSGQVVPSRTADGGAGAEGEFSGEEEAEETMQSREREAELEETPLESDMEEEDELESEYVDDDDETPQPTRKRRRLIVTKKGTQRKKGKQQDSPSREPSPSPPPEYRLPAVKARIQNELAAKAHGFFGDEHVVQPVRLPSPRAPSLEEDRAARDGESAPGGADLGGFDGGLGDAAVSFDRAPSPVDSLPDYDDENFRDDQPPPEAGLFPKLEEEELAEEQAYWTKPTKEGAVLRWAGVLAKDSVPLENYSLDRYEKDRNTLLYDLTPRLDNAARDLLLAAKHQINPTFASLRTPSLRSARFCDPSKPSQFDTLLARRPSAKTVNQLLEDFLGSEHPVKHKQPDDPDAVNRGRGCCCPLSVPLKRKSWEDARAELVGSGISVSDLIKVLEDVFGVTEEVLLELSARLEVTHVGQEELVGRIHDLNWVWFEQLVELASVHLFYDNICEPVVADALVKHIDLRQGHHDVEVEKLEAQLKRADEKARWGEPNDGALINQELLLMKDRWEKQDKPMLHTILNRILKKPPYNQQATNPTPAAPAPPASPSIKRPLPQKPRQYSTRLPSPPPPPVASVKPRLDHHRHSRQPSANSSTTLTPNSGLAILDTRSETPKSREERMHGWRHAEGAEGYHWREFRKR